MQYCDSITVLQDVSVYQSWGRGPLWGRGLEFNCGHLRRLEKYFKNDIFTNTQIECYQKEKVILTNLNGGLS